MRRTWYAVWPVAANLRVTSAPDGEGHAAGPGTHAGIDSPAAPRNGGALRRRFMSPVSVPHIGCTTNGYASQLAGNETC